MKRAYLKVMIMLLLLLPAVACSVERPAATAADGASAAPAEESATADGEEAVTRPEGWSEASHSNDAEPDYDVVFPQDEVNQITITIAPEDWEAMQANMTELFGEQGTGSAPGGRPGGAGPPAGFAPPGDGQLPEGGEPPAGFAPPGDGQRPEGFAPAEGLRPDQGGPGFGGGSFATENPMWVPATIEFNGETWTHVGVRYKGNSSLRSSWASGSLKLPLKLDFDEFEDDYPEIDDQRFYGFKQLSLANGFGDQTYMRDTITYDLLHEAGLVAAETAYYEVLLDTGDGPVSLGLYTVIEVIDDTVVDGYFGDDDGNIYEADGPAASLAESTFSQIESSFQKENNEDEADYGDIESLYNVLHSEERTSDPQAWRASLETIFDVDSFLEWLALSSVLQHWDTYGRMTHNYYLYNDPDSGRLTWISWDHNLVMGGLAGPGGMGERSNVSLDKADIGDNWPLIRFLLDDPVYDEAYEGYIAEAAGLLNPDKMEARYRELATLIEPYISVEEDASFETAVEQLIQRTGERNEATVAFLAQQ